MANSKIRCGIGRNSARHYEWRKLVKERDGECKNCGTKENLHAHHIIPWKASVEKRFELYNGITYCNSCHKKLDGCIQGGWNKGLKRSKEWCEKLSKSLKGRKVWNKGLKGTHFSPKTEFKKGIIPWNKGIKNIPEERVCKICKVNKKIIFFTPQQRGKFYSHTCKKCRNIGLRNGNNQSIESTDISV